MKGGQGTLPPLTLIEGAVIQSATDGSAKEGRDKGKTLLSKKLQGHPRLEGIR